MISNILWIIAAGLYTLLISTSIIYTNATSNSSLDVINSFNSNIVDSNNIVSNDSAIISAIVFVNGNFTGDSKIISTNASNLEPPFQDSISSIDISLNQNYSKGYVTQVCEHNEYDGSCMILEPGKYDLDSLDQLHDQISSIRFIAPDFLEFDNSTIDN